MPWHNPLTWTIGQILTAAQLNDQIRDNMQMTAPGVVVQAGDMVYATGPNALTRLPIGTAGQVPTVNPSANGLLYVTPGLTKLAESILLVDTANPITISGISANYRHLYVTANARTTRASTLDSLDFRFNGDAGSNYGWIQDLAFSSSSTVSQTASAGAIALAWIPGNTATAGRAGIAELVIYDYARTTFHKLVMARSTSHVGNAGTDMSVVQLGGIWRNAAAINSISFFADSGPGFVAGSTFAVYGMG